VFDEQRQRAAPDQIDLFLLAMAVSATPLPQLQRQLIDPEAANAERASQRNEALTRIDACADPGVLPELVVKVERRLRLVPRTAKHTQYEEDLSDRELAVLRLLATDLTQREIGEALYVSFNTIKTHVKSIFRKLDVAARADAVSRARELRLL
jgi:ATP/maltotriose-dependent transcriptional regulator MalT